MTAIAPPVFAQVELAIQERLRAASKQNVLGYALRAVDGLPVDIDDRLGEYVNDFPAAWTVFGGWTVRTERSSGGSEGEARYSVICAAQSLRNEGAARFGAGGEVGTYQMVADVVALLLGNDLGLDISPLTLGACQSLYSGAVQGKLKVSLFGVSFTTRMTIEAAPADVLQPHPLTDFTTFNAGWLAPAAGDDTPRLETRQTLEAADD